MLNTLNTRATEVGDTLVRASRQFWLAGLGAAVVTRDWAEKEGGVVFRNLVREGTAIESRAIRYVGDRLEMSFAQANTIDLVFIERIHSGLMASGPGFDAAMMTSAPLKASSSVSMRFGLVASQISHLR